MPTLTKSGKPRKVRSDKGKKRGPAPAGRKFMLGGGITNIPVYGAVVPSPAKRTRKGRPNPTKGYSRKAYQFMKGGGITNIPVPRAQRKPSAYNNYVKDNYRLVKSRHPGVSSKEVMKLVASQWRSYKGSGFFF